jgi:hypothetical protein
MSAPAAAPRPPPAAAPAPPSARLRALARTFTGDDATDYLAMVQGVAGRDVLDAVRYFAHRDGLPRATAREEALHAVRCLRAESLAGKRPRPPGHDAPVVDLTSDVDEADERDDAGELLPDAETAAAERAAGAAAPAAGVQHDAQAAGHVGDDVVARCAGDGRTTPTAADLVTSDDEGVDEGRTAEAIVAAAVKTEAAARDEGATQAVRALVTSWSAELRADPRRLQRKLFETAMHYCRACAMPDAKLAVVRDAFDQNKLSLESSIDYLRALIQSHAKLELHRAALSARNQEKDAGRRAAKAERAADAASAKAARAQAAAEAARSELARAKAAAAEAERALAAARPAACASAPHPRVEEID